MFFNVDETGITIVQRHWSNVISLKEKTCVCTITSADRGKIMTVITCSNACITYILPLFLFPRKNISLNLMDGTPDGSVWACHASGWVQGHNCAKWLNHFILLTRRTVSNPILLALDGSYNHTKNVDITAMARENAVSIVSLPHYSTHKIHPSAWRSGLPSNVTMASRLRHGWGTTLEGLF